MPLIKVNDIARVRFAAPDLQKVAAFLTDFGLACFSARGRPYGRAQDGRAFVHVTEPGDPRFLALGPRAVTLVPVVCCSAIANLPSNPVTCGAAPKICGGLAGPMGDPTASSSPLRVEGGFRAGGRTRLPGCR